MEFFHIEARIDRGLIRASIARGQFSIQGPTL
jgi:hypothetical protein